MPATRSHASPYSGQWYPAEPEQLRGLIGSCLEESVRRTGDTPLPAPIGLVVPHAGIVYSGTVAAGAWRLLQSSPPRRIFLIGFSHHGGHRGIWLPDVSAYETPLGEVRVDEDAVRELARAGDFAITHEDRVCDHSVEIQLPFLRTFAPEAAIVPVYACRPDDARRRAAAHRLAATAQAGDVMVASSDFTHYGRSFGFLPFPVDNHTPDRIQSLDSTVIEAAASLDDDIFLESLRDSEATVCGRDPISLLLAALSEMEDSDEVFQEKLDYQTSGEMEGDYHHSVSYAALGYFRHSTLALGAEEQALLLASARETLERYQQTGYCEPVPPARVTPALARHAGVFVSLHKNHELRGCVGRVTSEEPIADSVPAMTLAAATEDSRFHPVSAEETGIEIEISVLSPMKRVSSKDKIHAGTHGVFVDTGWRRGLLLPQVASERGWDTGQFLAALAAKIGVRPDVFDKPETRLHRFRAQVFH